MFKIGIDIDFPAIVATQETTSSEIAEQSAEVVDDHSSSSSPVNIVDLPVVESHDHSQQVGSPLAGEDVPVHFHSDII